MYSIGEAQADLAGLVERAAAGEEIVIGSGGRAVAELVGAGVASEPRRPGAWKGRVHIADAFDAPLDDLFER